MRVVQMKYYNIERKISFVEGKEERDQGGFMKKDGM